MSNDHDDTQANQRHQDKKTESEAPMLPQVFMFFLVYSIIVVVPAAAFFGGVGFVLWVLG